MRSIRLIVIALAAVSAASAAAIIDVSTAASQQMNPGDTLYFLLSNLSLRTDVQTIRFLFLSEPVDGSLQFEAELTSRDGAESVPFPEIEIVPGYLMSHSYSGPVSTISGAVTLPHSTSSQIWQNGRATLVLHDIGSTVNFSLAAHTLRDDLLATVEHGGRAAGAVVNAVLYQDPPPAVVLGNDAALIANTYQDAPAADAPENDSWLLTGCGVVILGVSVRGLKRSSRVRIQSL